VLTSVVLYFGGATAISVYAMYFFWVALSAAYFLDLRLALVHIAFAHVGLDWEKHVRIDPNLLRPAEVDHLLGDASKARAKLGWTPSVDFRQLVEMMVDADLQRLTSAPGRPTARVVGR